MKAPQHESQRASLPQAAANGEWPDVLTGLLEAWRATPHRVLADRILQVGAKVAQGQPLHGAWEEGRGDQAITAHPVMTSLRSLTNSDVGGETLAKLPRLESLLDDRAHATWHELAQDTSAFPRLRTLHLQVYAYQAQAVLTSPLARRLEQLQLRMDLPSTAPHALAVPLALLALAPTLELPDFTLRLVRNSTWEWASSFRFVREPSGGLSVHVATTEMNAPLEAIVQADVLTGLEQVAALKPSRFVVAHQLRTAQRDAVDARARALGATLEP